MLSNIFLGFQQGICWSLAIFMMIDHAGPDHRGFAVGLNETCGYVTLALMGKIAPLIIDEDSQNYQTTPLIVLLCFMGICLFLTVTVLKDTRDLAQNEQAMRMRRTEWEEVRSQSCVARSCIFCTRITA